MDWGSWYEQGGLVLSDRYTTSNAVHQASKLPETKQKEYLQWLYEFEYDKLGLPRPDLTIYLDVPTDFTQKLLRHREQDTNTQADIHEKDTAYLATCRKTGRAAKIDAAGADTFGFDCVCFIKALLWGWQGDSAKLYGGAEYASNGVPDIGEAEMLGLCSGVSTDFSLLQPGEVVWLPGHIGIYVGDGLVAEATPAWADGLQLTACNRSLEGYPRRDWVKHGKLPYVTYPQEAAAFPAQLRRGCCGSRVKALQLLLLGWGFPCGVWGADGDFGSATENAVKIFQVSRGLTPDGIVGSLTWRALLGCDGL
jgi:hypothetical protein